jgi:hypothetical protein
LIAYEVIVVSGLASIHLVKYSRQPPCSEGYLEWLAKVQLDPLPIARGAMLGILRLLVLLVYLSVKLRAGNLYSVGLARPRHLLWLASRVLV